ncbi:hypothetical protein ACFLZ9_02255 [Patescibacteria group bacterium]
MNQPIKDQPLVRPWPGKWNYQLIYHTNNPEHGEKFRLDYENAKAIERFDMEQHALEKTPLEQKIISSTIDALPLMFNKIGLKEVGVWPWQIYIIPEDLDKKLFGNCGDGGASSYGIAYLARSNNVTFFTRKLAHEIAHLISFHALRLEHYFDEETNNYKINYSCATPGLLDS